MRNQTPSSIAFDRDGNVYVGQADGTAAVLKFEGAGNLLATLHPAVGTRGTDHIDLSTDRCTLFYTSRTNDVLLGVQRIHRQHLPVRSPVRDRAYELQHGNRVLERGRTGGQ